MDTKIMDAHASLNVALGMLTHLVKNKNIIEVDGSKPICSLETVIEELKKSYGSLENYYIQEMEKND